MDQALTTQEVTTLTHKSATTVAAFPTQEPLVPSPGHPGPKQQEASDSTEQPLGVSDNPMMTQKGSVIFATSLDPIEEETNDVKEQLPEVLAPEKSSDMQESSTKREATASREQHSATEEASVSTKQASALSKMPSDLPQDSTKQETTSSTEQIYTTDASVMAPEAFVPSEKQAEVLSPTERRFAKENVPQKQRVKSSEIPRASLPARKAPVPFETLPVSTLPHAAALSKQREGTPSTEQTFTADTLVPERRAAESTQQPSKDDCYKDEHRLVAFEAVKQLRQRQLQELEEREELTGLQERLQHRAQMETGFRKEGLQSEAAGQMQRLQRQGNEEEEVEEEDQEKKSYEVASVLSGLEQLQGRLQEQLQSHENLLKESTRAKAEYAALSAFGGAVQREFANDPKLADGTEREAAGDERVLANEARQRLEGIFQRSKFNDQSGPQMDLSEFLCRSFVGAIRGDTPPVPLPKGVKAVPDSVAEWLHGASNGGDIVGGSRDIVDGSRHGTSLAAPSCEVGDEVEVFSKSRGVWSRGIVEHVKRPSCRVTVRFNLPSGGVATKELPWNHPELKKLVKVARKSASGTDHDRSYLQGVVAATTWAAREREILNAMALKQSQWQKDNDKRHAEELEALRTSQALERDREASERRLHQARYATLKAQAQREAEAAELAEERRLKDVAALRAGKAARPSASLPEPRILRMTVAEMEDAERRAMTVEDFAAIRREIATRTRQRPPSRFGL
eukprot:TRINITY_DN17964_c0_g1_i2.p1 TRINITY_DN17964_c0_g1~~TRINITY_DN17964_c0_g1_i2.p1  ORF type:complete len:799 (+),score=193.67 TRINITY_DN17964_c0_g1_i2:179-2398(+)